MKIFLQGGGIPVVVLLYKIKYVLYLHLCGGGCVSSMFGMDPKVSFYISTFE